MKTLSLLCLDFKKMIQTLPKTAEDLLLCTVCSFQNVECVDRDCLKCGVERPVDELFIYYFILAFHSIRTCAGRRADVHA